MNLQSSFPATVLVRVPRKAATGTYATGKGTTARLLNYLRTRPDTRGRNVASAGYFLELPPRQIVKRLSEQVKAGKVRKDADGHYHAI